MYKQLLQDIKQSGYIHRPLPRYTEHSLEEAQKRLQVLDSQMIYRAGETSVDAWTFKGVGEMKVDRDQSLMIISPTVMPHWPEGAPEDGDYTNFGEAWLTHKIDGQNWERFNRLAIELKADFQGTPNTYIMIKFRNEGVIPIPDLYFREGVHGINVSDTAWNTVYLNIADLPRDVITEIEIGYFLNGKTHATGDWMKLNVRSIQLELVDQQEVTKGWAPSPREIVFSHSGYRAGSVKTALAQHLDAEQFHIVRETKDEIVFSGRIELVETGIGQFQWMDFTPVTDEGRYLIQAGDSVSQPFTIGTSADVWQASIWKSLNFVFCERCGYPVPGIHGTCHGDVIAQHNGTKLAFHGGWHDAGDVSQQMIQTAEVTQALFELAEQMKPLDEDLYLRLIEEGEWGLDFILKMRFGDGYRATSAGITRWTDGRIGNLDDCAARVHNQAYENFYCAGIEASVHSRLPNEALSWHLLDIAKEDFQYALDVYEEVGFDQKPIFWEHTYQTSESLYMATASWAASMLYKETQDAFYAEKAAEFIRYVQQSQELDGIRLHDDTAIRGFFYRNPAKKVIQHFNHQAREHLYLQALVAVHETQPLHAEANSWLVSIQAYGEYLKHLSAYTAPYPMISSGLYLADEHLDEKSFGYQHLLVDEQAHEDYKLQLKEGVQLSDEVYLRRFPVWFSFKGNNAILLSTGKAASIVGRYLNDNTLLNIAEGQLQWIVGKNPFGQSLMYGEGYRYAQQYSVLSGEMTGEIPVGVQTFGNEDVPYWPQFNNATYKEVWVGLAGKWMSLLADLYAVDTGFGVARKSKAKPGD
ncbi:endoglucanase [Paenibacillus pectinilyticus]|uniref:Endoglucanase n=1 Tax=Paenibacillus pectinilyticus TaxID=512399 RepID=A0A1C0ZRN8_9BACL|nr:glycoside hydrolase family 9 protein [Paenibacillus pectinilyticus]OCT10726.1 endoglucanase [Paenibacillus pectinilyticus]